MERSLKQFQNHQILDWLKTHATLTRREAYDELGIANVTARITELRQSGVNIGTKIVHEQNQFGFPTHYAEWYLEPEEEQLSFSCCEGL